MSYVDSVLINEKYFELERGFKFANFVSPFIKRLTGPPRRKSVSEIILHETVTRNREITLGVLERRGLAAHFIVDQHGDVSQHGDLVLDQLAHAGRVHNPHSIGIEIVNPYYPEYNLEGPWDTTIEAHWAHKNKYILPTAFQAEAVYQLVKALTEFKADRFDIPRNWIGFDAKRQRFDMSRLWRARFPLPGIMAHSTFGHADGAWPMLYCVLRDWYDLRHTQLSEGGAVWAYNKAKKLGTTTKQWADLRGISCG